MKGVYEEYCSTLGMYQKPYAPFSESYNKGWQNHPNFNWKFDNQQHVQPNRTYTIPLSQTTSSRNSLEDTLHDFIEVHGKTNQKFETIINQVVEEGEEMKAHVSKLANALAVGERGKFPSQVQPNQQT